MTRAERLREIMEKSNEEKRLAYAAKNRRYANRIVSGKCHKRASQGYNHCEVKIKKKYSPTLVIETVEKMGFEVKRSSKNGKTVLMIKW
jgi:hypothetical protein